MAPGAYRLRRGFGEASCVCSAIGCKSEFLDFGHDYRSKEEAAQRAVVKMSLTRYTFEGIVAILAESMKKNERVRTLILVEQMVSEACRFCCVFGYLTATTMCFFRSGW